MNKEITLKGKTYPVVFDLQTMLNYEKIVGHSFFGATFEMMHDRIALLIAAIISANADAEIDSESIIKNADGKTIQELIAGYAIVMDLVSQFFKIPEVEKNSEPKNEPKDEEEGTKN